MRNSSLKLRPFNVGGNFEIVLPNGKVVLIDPYFTGPEFPDGHSREDVTGADYIILTHAHFDHDSDVGYFVKKFNAKVICGAFSAMDLLKFHRIPFDNLFPVLPGEKFTFEDFRLEIFRAKHNPSGGRTWDPDRKPRPGMEAHQNCDTWGSVESIDFMLTTNNNYRILMASGRVVWSDLFDICMDKAPNLLLRQSGVRKNFGDLFSGEQATARELAELFVKYHCQTIIPFHQDVMQKNWGLEKLNEYFDEVAKIVSEIDPGAQMLNPVAWQWYDLGADVLPCEQP